MTNSQSTNIDYKKVLSAVASDMRNSLTLMFQSLQALSMQRSAEKTISSHDISDINYQVQRINGGLTQLMALYNAQQDRLMINISEQLVCDMLESVICQNDLFSESKGIKVELNVEEDFTWCLDADLISYLIDDVLSNALRYSKEHVRIDAGVVDGQLNITISDDSDGYPQQMIDASQANFEQLTNDFGRMGIGLLFSKLIVVSHVNGDQHGQLLLSNDSQFGGSSFVIRLP